MRVAIDVPENFHDYAIWTDLVPTAFVESDQATEFVILSGRSQMMIRWCQEHHFPLKIVDTIKDLVNYSDIYPYIVYQDRDDMISKGIYSLAWRNKVYCYWVHIYRGDKIMYSWSYLGGYFPEYSKADVKLPVKKSFWMKVRDLLIPTSGKEL